MGKCVYNGCTNNKNKCKDIAFFKFPSKNVERTREWQKNCGNTAIALMDFDVLGNKLICEKHFLTTDFIINNQRKLLCKKAVPEKFEKKDLSHESTSTFPLGGASGLKTYPGKGKLVLPSSDLDNPLSYLPHKSTSTFSLACASPLKTYPGKAKPVLPLSDSDSLSGKLRTIEALSLTLQQSDSCDSDISNKITNVPSQNSKLVPINEKLKAKNIQNSRLKKKLYTKAIVKKKLANRSKAVKNFTNMQLFHRKNTAWSYSQKELALSLYYKSPESYKYTRSKLGFVLPSIRTIKSWLKISNLVAGVKTTLTTKLRAKVKTMSDTEKLCVIMFGEVTLEKKLEHNKLQDIIEGYEDLGLLGRNEQIGDTALIFYIQGLLHYWKIPFCYYISSGPTKYDVLKELIGSVITELINISLKPMVLVCDQGATNRSVLTKLGATQEHPVVYINNYKIFTCFDPPHLLKNLRDNFMNPRLNFLINKKAVSWNDVVQAYEIERNNMTSRALRTISHACITPNVFQKLRVKFAEQIFSNTMSSAVSTTSKLNQLISSTGEETADFLKNIGIIFDALNSRSLKNGNPDKRPLSVFANTTLQNLRDGLEYLKQIEVYSSGKIHNIYCIDGFMWTIRAILLLWDDLQKQKVKYLATGFINQEALENFNSIIRNKIGCNLAPSVRQLRLVMQQNMFMRLQLGVDGRNVEDDEAEVLELNEKDEEREGEFLVTKSCDLDEASSGSALQPTSAIVKLESSSIVYFAGYLAFKQLKEYECEICTEKMIESERELFCNNELYLMRRDYGTEQIKFLKRPTDSFVDFVSHLLNVFNSLFVIHKCAKGVVKNIFTCLISESEQFSEVFCIKHKNFIINLLIKLKMYAALNMESERI
ncbi:hypothetical protein FQR65_LT10676 [Abscondita terminalis]|nr:hypothetical protein FQR65_LT10676 [Abscondita terminalis]